MLLSTNKFKIYQDEQAKLLDELRNELAVYRQANEELITIMTRQQETIDIQQRTIGTIKQQLEVQDQTMNGLQFLKQRKESDEPWIEVMGGDVDPDKGLQLNLDWNDAFINQLRAQGYKGTTEGSLVGQWLLAVSQSVAGEEEDA